MTSATLPGRPYIAYRGDSLFIEGCRVSDLAKQHGIVGIPVSAFYQTPPDDLRLIRFCFAKKTETLLHAGEILSAI